MQSSKAYLSRKFNHIAEFDHLGHGYEVERLSQEMAIALNSGDVNGPAVAQRMAPGYTIDGDHAFLANPAWRAGTIRIEERLRMHRDFMEQNPDYYVDITEFATYMDEDMRMADVLLVCNVTGLPMGMNGNGIIILRWEWRKCRWMCVKNIGLRGCVNLF